MKIVLKTILSPSSTVDATQVERGIACRRISVKIKCSTTPQNTTAPKRQKVNWINRTYQICNKSIGNCKFTPHPRLNTPHKVPKTFKKHVLPKISQPKTYPSHAYFYPTKTISKKKKKGIKTAQEVKDLLKSNTFFLPCFMPNPMDNKICGVLPHILWSQIWCRCMVQYH